MESAERRRENFCLNALRSGADGSGQIISSVRAWLAPPDLLTLSANYDLEQILR